MHENISIAIIGCGLSGTSLLCQLVNRIERDPSSIRLKSDNLRVIIFEKGSQMGPGMPHNAEFVQPYHITNMCAEHMSIFHDRPGDLQIWMQQNRASLRKAYLELMSESMGQQENSHSCNHYPRALVGEYLMDRFNSHVDRGSELGMQITLLKSTEVINLQDKQDHVAIQAEDLASGEVQDYQVDRAVISTGHWFREARGDGYFPSPWPAERLLQNIPNGSRVAVIGTSLSAIETALTLTADGGFVKKEDDSLEYQQPENPRYLALFSRNGLLPTVRGKIGSYVNQVLTPDKIKTLLNQKAGQLQLDTLFALLDAELQRAYDQPFDWQIYLNAAFPPAKRLSESIAIARNGDGPEGDVVWQTVLHQILPFVRDLYLALSMAERKRFEKQYKTSFFIFAAPQPIINAQKLLALIKAGSVHIHRLAPGHHWDRHCQTQPYPFDYIDGQGRACRESYSHVVDARGQHISWQDNPSNLAQNILGKGLIKTTEIRMACTNSKHRDLAQNDFETYDAGSVWIDPQTHAVMQVSPNGKYNPSDRIFAVGAMTRGQIIDASMAQSLAESTNRIVSRLLQL